MKEVAGGDEVALQLCPTCGGVWIDGADLNRLLLHNNLPGMESLGGRVNLDELSDRCPRDQVDLVVVQGGEKGALRYDACEACGAVWLDLELPEDAGMDEIEPAIVAFFRKFRVPAGPARSVRP